MLGTGNQTLPAGVGLLDANAGRPPRQNQWSFGIQRELKGDIVVEAAYVGNRGAWWASPQMNDINALTPQVLASRGLSLDRQADVTLLTSTIGSAAAVAAGFKAPYAGFSAAQTVAQSLRPFPQFGTIPVNGAPLGKTWYDSLQMKMNKRMSHGLNLGSAFTWQKSEQVGVDVNQNLAIGLNGFVNNVVANPQSSKSLSRFDQPFSFVLTASYQVPKWAPGKALSWITKDWQFGALVQYASGLPIPTPPATSSILPAGVPANVIPANLANLLFQPTLAVRVPGQPLFNVDLNCHCYDPSTTFVLNKNAWTQPQQGKFSDSSQYYSDYRYQRHPSEGINFGRTFKFGTDHRYGLHLDAEFSNIFNRTQLADANLTVTNPFAAQSTNGALSGALNGTTSAGFGTYGRLTSGTQFGQPRAGTIVARFTF